MLGFFTDPYPDELLYSACARYSEQARYPNYKTNLKVLFGSPKYSAVVDFPTRLNSFVSSLPEGNVYNTEKLINENTLLPFYEPFLPGNRAEVVRREMAMDSDNKIHVRLGIRAKQINAPDYLRFCPLCLEEDRDFYGETYWHRMHQLAGILVCSKHKCFLEDSYLKWDRKVGYQFYPAEQFVVNTPPHYLNDENQDHKVLLKISQDAEWLLSQKKLQLSTEIIRDRYFNQLLKFKFAYYNGNLRHDKFLEASNKIFSRKLFEMVGRISRRDNWLLDLVQKGNTNVTYHPIRHLILINFLGLSARQFFNSYTEFKPFAAPPYPCLNLISNHYGELKIQKCIISDNISKDIKKQGIPIGIFSCECGFIYKRLGPDKSDEDKFRFDSIRQYGDLWERELANHWANLDLSLAEIARRFGTTTLLIARHAIRLNLPMNTEGTRSLQGYNKHRNPKNRYSTQLQNYRNEWLIVRRQHPKLSRRELNKTANFLYLWLQKHDFEWLEQHLPEIVKGNKRKDHLDWKKVDKKLSRKVESACNEILNTDGRPIRVCITEIIKRVGHKSWIEKREKKLPLTTEVVNKFLEKPEDYMIRKVKWAEEEFIKEGRIPTRLQFTVKAVVRNKTSASPKVQKAIDEALARLEKKLGK